jgi:hypothetical protein
MISRTLLLAFLFSLPGQLLANVGGYTNGVGKSGDLTAFQPKNAERIEMQTEDLQIDLLTESTRVRVEYQLHNPGRSTEVVVGFPYEHFTFGSRDHSKPSERIHPSLPNFKAFFDDKPVAVTIVAEKTAEDSLTSDATQVLVRQIPYWYTFKLKFPGKESRTLRIEYHAPYHVSEMSVSDDTKVEPSAFVYSLSPAAVWKGPIQRGKATIRAIGVPPEFVRLNLAKRFQKSDSQWTWEFTNLEPTKDDDLIVFAYPGYQSKPRTAAGKHDEPGDGPTERVEFRDTGGKWSMRHRQYSVSASSTHPNDGELNYAAENVKNGSIGSAWVEGAEGDGLGESLELKLKPARRLSHLAIRNGLCKSESHYFANGRVAELAISINGKPPFLATIPDEFLSRNLYEIPLPKDAPEVRTLKLTIQKVYRGSKYADTCIDSIALVTPLSKPPKLEPTR